MPGARSGPGTRPTSGRETRWTTFTTYLAFRNTRMKEEAMALKYVRALLQVDPRNRQAQVRLLIENWIKSYIWCQEMEVIAMGWRRMGGSRWRSWCCFWWAGWAGPGHGWQAEDLMMIVGQCCDRNISFRTCWIRNIILFSIRFLSLLFCFGKLIFRAAPNRFTEFTKL